jgi:hypothetical protein
VADEAALKRHESGFVAGRLTPKSLAGKRKRMPSEGSVPPQSGASINRMTSGLQPRL